MTIAYMCIVAMIILPYLCVAYSKFTKGYDNHDPRKFIDGLTGPAKRAANAQLNCFENFPPFAIGIIVATFMQAPQTTIDNLSILFVVARIAYCMLYIADKDKLRSLAWFVGFITTLSLYFIGIK